MVKRVADTPLSDDDADTQLNNPQQKTDDETAKSSKKRVKTQNIFRQPTVKELNRLQETESLFNSNLFRLQVEEILQEVKVQEKTEKKFQEWYTEFKNHLLSIPNHNVEYDLSDDTLPKKLKVKIPISSRIQKTKCSFKFNKFKDVTIVGSYALGCSINSKLRVDLQITVPAETYTKNDSINYRYHKKRAAYLACIATHIKSLETVENITYTRLNGCESIPVLDLVPSGKLSKHLSVRINLACEAEAYKYHRFSPLRNNLREAWLLSDNSENTEIGPPTPYYNSSILADITAIENLEFINETLSKSDNLKQAIVLMKIWLRQRKLQVSGHVVSLLVAYLVQIKRINNIMSSYQIVRNIWIALKTSEWDKKGISLHKGEDSPPLEEFHKQFPVVFLDKTGYYNVCWQLSLGTYQALRRESLLAVDMLDNGNLNSFLPLFMVPVKPLMQFDYILQFKDLEKLKQSVLSKVSKSDRVNYGLDELALIAEQLHSLFVKGLDNRVDLILPLVDADFSWPVNKNAEKAMKNGYKKSLSFGFVYNQENFLDSVQRGPSANLPEAEQFRAFWGAKSELRRFQDGSITEACVWSADTLAERRQITSQIVQYLLTLKYDVKPAEVFHIGDQFSSLLSRKQYASQTEEASLEVLRAFDDLRRDIRQLTELPLDVSAVYGTSPVFSYCEPVPPGPAPSPARPWRRGATTLLKGAHVPEYTPANRVVLELGHSGKWPANIEAFRCLKAAFNLQIADRLTKQYDIPTQAYPSHIDVLKNGLVFRLEIAHPKEITLLKKEMENGVAKFKETDDSLKLQCDTVLLPRLRGALHGLHQKHPALGPAVCLFKRWLSSHLLSSPHFPPTLAELVVASGFLHPQPLVAPNEPSVGLLRTLRLLAKTDWRTEMIVLDFHNDMKREEILELETKFSSREDKVLGIHLVTSYDGDLPAVWGSQHPVPQVLARIQTLAKSTLGYVNDALLKEMKDNILGVFVPSMKGYDVLINLKPELVPYVTERVDHAPILAPLPTASTDIIPVVEFHPVQRYLDELRNAFSEFAVFFHDCYGGAVIAVLWKPDIDEPREFQLSNANALKPIEVKGVTQYRVNKEALVEDFRLLGEGLVQDVTVNT